MPETRSELTLVVTVSFAGAVGYGDLYKCHIVRQVKGSLNESEINIVILASDRGNSDFMSSHLHPTQIEIEFAIAGQDEPYNLAPISGFVDKERNSWRIVSMREVNKSTEK